MTELAAHTPQGVPPSYTHLKYSKIPALKTLTQNIGSCCQWRVHVVVYYVRMTRTGWYNLPGSECSIPEREHSLVPPYNTQMDHGEEQIASYLTVLKIQEHTQHCITHIPAQRPGYLHLVISCIFTDQTLTEVWMEDEWKETKLLILQEVTKTFNRTFCCSVLASLYRERLYLQKECDCIYIHYAETFFVENLNGMSPIRQKSVQSSKYANKCK